MIRIHPLGTRPNAETKSWLNQNAPIAYNNAQRIAHVANKCAKPAGIFSKPEKHLPDLAEALDSMIAAIEHHNLRTKDGYLMEADEFLSLFSDAHPNWQRSYQFLNQHVFKVPVGLPS